MDTTKITLLSVADGPEGIEIYLSEDEAVMDWSNKIPALYLTANVNGAYVKLGPFQLKRVIEGVKTALKQGQK